MQAQGQHPVSLLCTAGTTKHTPALATPDTAVALRTEEGRSQAVQNQKAWRGAGWRRADGTGTGCGALLASLRVKRSGEEAVESRTK